MNPDCPDLRHGNVADVESGCHPAGQIIDFGLFVAAGITQEHHVAHAASQGCCPTAIRLHALSVTSRRSRRQRRSIDRVLAAMPFGPKLRAMPVASLWEVEPPTA
jgi:hypothetical protein